LIQHIGRERRFEAVVPLFETLDWLVVRLTGSRWLIRRKQQKMHRRSACASAALRSNPSSARK
jgi:hypothetical protein